MASQDSRIEARSGGNRASTTSSITKFALRSSDIRELYEAARSLSGMGGGPYLNRLFDAEAALKNGRLDRVCEILSTSRREFEKSHTRILRFRPNQGEDGDRSPKEQARLQLRKEQIEEVLTRFDQYHAVTERMVERAERAGLNVEATEVAPSVRHDDVELPAGFKEAFGSETTTDDQFRVVELHFECVAVETADLIIPGALYFLRTKTTGFILQTTASGDGPAVRMRDVLTKRNVKPQPIEALIEQGKKQKFYALTRRSETKPAERAPSGDEASTKSTDPLEAQNALLDKQLFNVLMTAVRNSGLDISTELIVTVRDNEFRKGEFLDAFEKLNQLSTRYDVAAARRKEELRRNDQWLASGQSGLSMREVEEAKLQNARERTRLEHGSHRFGLVVEPLRILARGKS